MVSGEHIVIYRKYYEEADVLLSTEGILKIVSILGCIALVCVGVVAGGRCGTRVAGVALTAGVILALLLAAAGFRMPLKAPQAAFYTEIILSAVGGATILVVSMLNMALCDHGTVLNYFMGSLGVCVSLTMTASCAASFRAVFSHHSPHARAAAASEARSSHIEV